MIRLWRWFERRVSRENRWHVLAMAVVLVLSFALRFDRIALSLPYSRHADEPPWVGISFRMLQTGSANPKRFNYPSLPIYVMTAGFATGLWGSELAGKAKSAKDLGRHIKDYYQLPRAALPPKSLFAFASVFALGAAGFVGFLLTRRAAMLWLTPLLGAISESYFERSWSYMNVDIMGAGFAWATLAYLFYQHTRGHSFASGPGSRGRLVVLGVLSGLTVGCKYNLFPILLPGALWFLLFDRRRWLLNVTLLGVVAVVTFFLTTPYALVTPRLFVSTLAAEAHHYATGHRGREPITPGLPMLWLHLRHFGESFGWLPYFLSFVGAGLLVVRNAKPTILLLAWAVSLVGYMSIQRVFFDRNVTSLHPLIAMTLAFALLDLPERAAKALSDFRPALASRALPKVIAAALGLLLVLGIPWRSVAMAYSRHVEPRNEAIDWLRSKKRDAGTLIVDNDLNLDYRRVERRLKVYELDPDRSADAIKAAIASKLPLTVVTTDQRRPLFDKGPKKLKEKARFSRPDRHGAVVILER